jgi:hypothetical protein
MKSRRECVCVREREQSGCVFVRDCVKEKKKSEREERKRERERERESERKKDRDGKHKLRDLRESCSKPVSDDPSSEACSCCSASRFCCYTQRSYP